MPGRHCARTSVQVEITELERIRTGMANMLRRNAQLCAENSELRTETKRLQEEIDRLQQEFADREAEGWVRWA
jgi:ABC-type phosphate transport system auxiliary subunit